MEHLGNDESPSIQYWWTHRSLSDEAACLSMSPSVEALILSCVDAVKEKARGLLVSHVSDVQVAELVALRDRLIAALKAADEEVSKEDGDSQFAKPPTDLNSGATLRRTVDTILFRLVMSEWVMCYNSGTLPTTFSATATPTPPARTAKPTLDFLVDNFLYSVTVTHAAQWGDDVLITLCTLLTSTFSMTPLEQEKLLPRFSASVWDSFVQELHVLGEEGKSFVVLPSHSARFLAAPALVDRAVRVLRMIYVSSAASATGHVFFTTSAKAKVVVDSLSGWLPGVGQCLRLMAFGSKDDEEKGNEEESLDRSPRTSAARDWARRLQHYVQRLFSVFAQHAQTAAWTIPLSNIVARAFQGTIASNTASPTTPTGAVGSGTYSPGELLHETFREHLVWMSKNSRENNSTGAVSPRSLADICAMKMGHVLSCALDLSVPQNSLSVRLLCILLSLRPLQTLRHFLTFLCPSGSVAAACDFESVVTEKGSSTGSRQRAFAEDPIEENDVFLTFFPKYFAVFRAVEQALVNLCEELQDTEAVERFMAAALDESFSGMESAGGAAASEWLMFLALVCAEEPPVQTSALPHVRGAACRFFAPRRVMMAYLHRHIVRLERHGLAAFFLPPLRAIGVDYSTAADVEHVSCAMRYPLSAEAAYFQELPRGYYMRQPRRLARNAKNDALLFFHDVFTLPSWAKRPDKRSEVGNANSIKTNQIAKEACDKMAVNHIQTSKEDENNIVRSLFVDIIAHIGAAVVSRNVAVTTRSGTQHSSKSKSYQNHGHHSRHAPVPKYDPVAIDVMSSVFYGVLRLCRSVTYWDEVRRHELQRSIVSRLYELCAESPLCGKTNVLGWPLSFLLSEHGEANDNVMKQTPVLAPDASKVTNIDVKSNEKVSSTDNEEKKVDEIPKATVAANDSLPHAWLDWFYRADFEDVDSRACSCALLLLRVCNRDYLKCIPTKTVLTCRAMLEQHASKENDLRVRTVSAITEAVRLDMTALRSRNGKTVAPSAVSVNGTAKSVPLAPLSFTAVREYVESLVSALVCRACVSIVDGLAASASLRLWLSAAAGHVEPHALFETVYRAVSRTAARLAQSTTRLECAALAAFLGDVADNIALPYCCGFHAATAPRDAAKEEQEKETEKHLWMKRALPVSERKATELMTLIIDDASRAVRRFLEERTVLGDWKSFTAAHALRHVLRLVLRYEAPFSAALKKRAEELGDARNGAAHPLRMLSAMEFPLLSFMTAPVAEVEQLFPRSSAVRQSHQMTSALPQKGTKPSHEPYQSTERGRNAVREKRSRSVEGDRARRRTRRRR